MRSYLFLFLLLLNSILTFGQDIDEEKQVNDILDNVYQNWQEEPELFNTAAKELSKMYESHKDVDSLKIIAHNFKVIYYDLKKHKDSSYLEMEKLMSFFRENPERIKLYPKKYASNISAMASENNSQSRYRISSSLIYEALNNLKDHSPRIANSLYYDLGYLNLYLKNEEISEKMFKKALSDKEQDIYTTNFSYVGLGDTFLKKNLDSAHYYYQKAKPFVKSLSYKLNYYENQTKIAKVLIKKGEFKQASALLDEILAYQLTYKTPNTENIANAYLLFAEIAAMKDEVKREYDLLQEAEKYLAIKSRIQQYEELYEKYLYHYTRTNNYKKRYEYELKLYKLRDSILNKDKLAIVKELEIKYKSDLKDTELTNKDLLLKTKKKQWNYLLFAAVVLTILLLVATYFYNSKLRAQNALNKEKVGKLLEQQKIESLKAQIEGQNNERKRISKDLHDSISGNLAALKLKLSNLVDQTEEVQSIVNSIDNTYHEVRTISHDLLPKEIMINTFTDLMKQLVNFKSSEGLQITSEFFPEEELDKTSEKLQVELYRILQELLTNIQKHAQATAAFVNLTHHKNALSLMIEDNGKGFDTSNITEGIGLKNIRSRLQSIAGTIEIDSSNGKGTTTNIYIPIG